MLEPSQSRPIVIDELKTEPEAAEALRVNLTYLESLRRNGRGPPHVRLSRKVIRYRPIDLARWLEARSAASVSLEGAHSA